MYCPKCNKEVNTGKLFCNVCGSRLVEKDAEIQDNETIDINSGFTQVIDIPSMVKSYVGDSYDKIRSVNFSIWYFLFGVYYAIYRKMYLFSVIYLAANIGLLYINFKFSLILFGILNIVISLIFNNMYLLSVEKKVQKIRKKNSGLNRVDLLKVCKYTGGVNYLPSLLAMILIFMINYNINKGMIDDLLHRTTNTPVEDYKELVFKNPSGFSKKSVGNSKYDYNYETKKDSCNYTIEITSTSNTAYNYLNRKTTYSEQDKKTPIGKQSINGNEWNYMEIDTLGTAYIYDYAIINNHSLYNITYRVYEDSGQCSKMKDELIESLDFKTNE